MMIQVIMQPKKWIGILFMKFFCLVSFGADISDKQAMEPLSDIKLEFTGEIIISDLFSKIEDQTELTFSYHRDDLKDVLSSRIILSAKNSSLKDVLIEICKEKNLRFKRVNKVLNVLINDQQSSLIVDGDNYFVDGRVLDENGLGLPGASVLVKGTSIGKITDSDGYFVLDVPDSVNTLEVRFLGYQTISVDIRETKSRLIIQMKPEFSSLDQVVVVGYGEQKKESITGAVAKIDSDEIVKTKSANVVNSLVGRLPGLVINARGGEPGAENIEVLIRGKSTTGDNSPLYVIDGVANRGSFNRLNPEDIESISVLKDASAAIYGAQAANGVILVTTKRGTEGSPSLRYQNTFSITQPARRQNLMSAEQYLTWVDEQNMRNGRPQIYANVIEDYQNGENDPEVWSNTDWWDESIQKWTPQYQHSLSMSGGSPSFKYYVSGQHLYQDAIFKGDEFGFRQSNLRSNLDVDVTSYLKLGLDLAGRFEERKGTGGIESAIRGIYNMAPFESAYYSNGLLRKTSKGNILPGLDGTSGGSQLNRNVFNNKLSASIDLGGLVKGLSITGFGAIDILNQERKVLRKPYDIYFLNEENVYENLREETGNISLFHQFDEELSQTYHARINYENEFERHKLSGFVAYEQNQLKGEYIAASRMNLVSEDLPFLFTGNDANKDNDGRGWQSARVNYFGRLNYSYDDKYLLELTYRRDGSQNFGKGSRFGNFPGASVGWRISEEEFWGSSLVEDLKLRFSWGKLGNDRVSDFQYFQLYNVEDAAVFGENPGLTTGLSPSTTANPNITWEISNKTNLGLDLSFSKGFLDLSIDYFKEKRSNILAKRNASVPIYTGVQLPDENIGITKNSGLELSLLHRGRVKNELEYLVRGQFTYSTNEIVFIDESTFIPEWQKLEGSPIDYLLVYQAKGLYQSQEEINSSPHFADAKPGDVWFEDINEDGVINNDDRVLLPEGPTPKIVLGLTLGIEWKGIELNAFFQGQMGASTIYRPWDINQDSWYFENRWISAEETPDAQSPAAWDLSSSNFQSISSIWVKENDFIRIKNVELAYTVPDQLTNSLGLSGMRVFVSGFNLGFIYDKVKIYDPESRSGTGWYYPQQRIISTGLTATF